MLLSTSNDIYFSPSLENGKSSDALFALHNSSLICGTFLRFQYFSGVAGHPPVDLAGYKHPFRFPSSSIMIDELLFADNVALKP